MDCIMGLNQFRTWYLIRFDVTTILDRSPPNEIIYFKEGSNDSYELAVRY